jgi:hypothetical protein
MWKVDVQTEDHLRCSHGNGYPPQSRERNPIKKPQVSCVIT